MKSKKNRKRIRIIVLWVVFLIVINFLVYHIENTIHFKNAQKELSDQAKTVALQIPSIVENDLCTQVGWEMLFAKLRTLAFALEPYDDIEEAGEFLEDYAQEADIEGLTIYDRNAQIIYSSADSLLMPVSAEDVNTVLDSGAYELQAQETQYNYTEEIASLVFSSLSLDEVEQTYYWGAKDQWLILFSNTLSEDWVRIDDYFRWTNVL